MYFRLNVIGIDLPPLRERGNDVRLIAEYFTDVYSREFRKPIQSLAPAAMEKLLRYNWPGNVRELRNTIERAVLLSKGTSINADDLVVGQSTTTAATATSSLVKLPPGGVKLAALDEDLIRQALITTRYNQTRAAKMLGISRDQLKYRIDRYGLTLEKLSAEIGPNGA